MNDYKFRIGVPGWSTGENSFGCTKRYLQWLSYFGSPTILCPDSDINENLDAIFLPGGKDVSTHLYGQTPSYFNSDADQFKEYFMVNNLKKYIEKKIPIVATCLGMQQLVVHFGGQLLQNIPDSHGHTDENKRWELENELIFTDINVEIRIKNVMKVKKKNEPFKVNSLHHQGTVPELMPDCLKVVAKTADNIVEIIEHKTLPIIGWQYHPEDFSDPVSSYIFSRILRKSPNYINHEAAVDKFSKQDI